MTKGSLDAYAYWQRAITDPNFNPPEDTWVDVAAHGSHGTLTNILIQRPNDVPMSALVAMLERDDLSAIFKSAIYLLIERRGLLDLMG